MPTIPLARLALARLPLLCLATLTVMSIPLTLEAATQPPPVPQVSGTGPTVSQVIELKRLANQTSLERDELRGRVSPNRERAFVVTRNANLRNDTTTYQFLLLDVLPGTLQALRPPDPVNLLQIEARDDRNYIRSYVQDARWHDDRTIVFRARIQEGPYQAYMLDATTKRLTQLSFEPHGVEAFGLSADRRRVVVASAVPNPPLAPGRRGIVVGNNSFWSVVHGQEDLRAQKRRYRYGVAEAGSGETARPLGPTFPEMVGGIPPISVSPDGRWAIVAQHEPGRHAEWVQRYPLLADLAKQFGPASKDPLSYYTQPFQWLARSHVAYRLDDGEAITLLDAPDDATPVNPLRRDRLWQSNGRSVVIAGIHLPTTMAGNDRAESTASHILEFWPDTGRRAVIASLRGRLGSLTPLDDEPSAFVVDDDGSPRVFRRTPSGTWAEGHGEGQIVGRRSYEPLLGGWQLRIDQGLNRPVDLIAVGPTGQRLRLTNLNPAFVPTSWGTMEPFNWQDENGRNWEGGLMVPADHDPSRRYPLVIQTYGFSSERFYLEGTNTADGSTSGFPGRAFMREGILVLALPHRARDYVRSTAPDEARRRMMHARDGIRAVIRTLVARGLVDGDRVGLMGWSATGEEVLNLLAFTDIPIKAATILDGDANTVFSAAIAYGYSDQHFDRLEKINQGLPFGPSLPTWVRNDPALHTDCIAAALRIETYGPWVLANWDIHALMRRQYKPVEMLRLPGGAHSLGRASDRMVSLQGNVDWYRFWLKGEERQQPVIPGETPEELRQQYERWRQMRELKARQVIGPHCAAAAWAR